jgi:hypothetical protein
MGESAGRARRWEAAGRITADRIVAPAAPAAGVPGTIEFLQRSAGNRAVGTLVCGDRSGSVHGSVPVQRFTSPEHVHIGDTASHKQTTTIRYGDAPGQVLSFGEVSALTGDYFESVAEMTELAKTSEGRQEIRYVRWKALATPADPMPKVDERIKLRADHRFVRLLVDNATHFAAGGTAATTYEQGHVDALRLAFQAGLRGDNQAFVTAMTVEAGAQHYLTDMFAGGHIRMPRLDIQQWYQQNLSYSDLKINEYLVERLKSHIIATNPTAFWVLKSHELDIRVRQALEGKAGPAFSRISLGDIVGMALHDYDNAQGVRVNSVRDAQGDLSPTTWRAYGDGSLNSDAAGPTRERVMGAAQASIAELTTARQAGASQRAGAAGRSDVELADAAIAAMRPFAAASRLPRAVSGNTPIKPLAPAGDDTTLAWRWGSFTPATYAAVDRAVKVGLAGELERMAAGSEHQAAIDALAKELAESGIEWLATALNIPPMAASPR